MTREEMSEAVLNPWDMGEEAKVTIAAQLRADGETIARLKAAVLLQDQGGVDRSLDPTIDSYHSAVAAFDRMRARVAELEAALKPIVAWCEKLEAEFSDHAGDIVVASFGGVFVTFDDLRFARRAALRPAEKGDAT